MQSRIMKYNVHVMLSSLSYLYNLLVSLLFLRRASKILAYSHFGLNNNSSESLVLFTSCFYTRITQIWKTLLIIGLYFPVYWLLCMCKSRDKILFTVITLLDYDILIVLVTVNFIKTILMKKKHFGNYYMMTWAPKHHSPCFKAVDNGKSIGAWTEMKYIHLQLHKECWFVNKFTSSIL